MHTHAHTVEGTPRTPVILTTLPDWQGGQEFGTGRAAGGMEGGNPDFWVVQQHQDPNVSFMNPPVSYLVVKEVIDSQAAPLY